MAETPLTVEIDDNATLAELVGPYSRNLADIEGAFGVRISQRGNIIAFEGEPEMVEGAIATLARLEERVRLGRGVEPGDVQGAIRLARPGEPKSAQGDAPRTEIRTRKKVIEPRSASQRAYIHSLMDRSLSFGVGPAGTGKTYLAVAAAVNAFIERRVERIVLSRPAVEAGERLGFLPGDLKEKIDPYLRPLYDSLHDMLPGEQVTKFLDAGTFEVAPLAFMRGRTLSNAFVVLDEAQNTTHMQMKMFLTRLGENAQMAVTGDPSQVDLPRGETSGLAEAVRLLDGIEGVGVTRFSAEDVVRHPLVARIIAAYDGAGGHDHG